MNYKEIEGNLITLALNGEFDVITHGCNCHCQMGAGIAPQMAKAFRADKYPLENQKYKGDYNKLGQIDFDVRMIDGNGGIFTNQESSELYRLGQIRTVNEHKPLWIVNAYTQYNYGVNHKNGSKIPLDYDALRMCMRKINYQFKGKKIGLPYVIGCGLAGGDIMIVLPIIKEELKDMDITMVRFNG